ncbi:MAG TPA: DUF1998 domain-containing protein, partial [Armatimonadetes bacterium]|nr:DUF1998 domain-containing protein [Armatimonadota bacterium]
GYPGSIASTFQQAGRDGRVEEGLVFLIASSNPVDQYVLHHPEYLFSKGAEPTIVNANNRYITAAHLLCAAHEHPLSDDDTNYFGESVMEIANQLSGAGYLTKVAIHDGGEFYKDSSTGAQRTHYLWAGSERPHDAVGIRTITGRNYEIRDLSQGEALLGTVDEDRAFATVYEGAIYLHAGNTYRVRRLDIPNRVAYVEPVNVDEYTLPLRHTDVTIQSTICDESLPKADAAYGELNVSQQVFAYKRLRLFTEQVIEICPLELPPQEFDTIGLWLLPAFEITELLESKGMNVMGALHAAEHALTALMPLVTLCDIHDIAGVSYGVHPQIGRPAIFIYDVYPGGAGFAESAFE